MQKINFQNLPNTTTPVNATNLNAVQTNVEDVFNGTVPMGNIKVDTVTSKNLFNIDGEVNVRGNTGGIEPGLNTVSGNVLTSNINGNNEYAVGQKLPNLSGKTVTFSAKLYSKGNADGGGIAIFDNNTQKAAPAIVNTGDYVTYTYTATSDNIVFGFYSVNGTEAQFTDIQVEIGDTRTSWAEYQDFDTAKFYDKTEINYIGADADLNDFLTTGCYTNGGQNPAHNPVGSAFVGLLIVFKSYYVGQMIITSDYYYNIYVRFYNGAEWGSWRALN